MTSAARPTSAVGAYFENVFNAVRTILTGLRITLRYHFARPVTLQYPEAPPALSVRFRGFHWFEIEKCIACDMCAKACPIDCIYIEKSAARKIDKATGIARGGAVHRFAIDYSKCMFCALCVEPCPTDCIHMGDIHDLSGFDRRSVLIEFTDLAKLGLQTPQPLWMTQENPPDWALKRRQAWTERGLPLKDEMIKALSESAPAPAAKPAADAAAAAPPKAG